jgi:hypothetical protein
MGSRVRDVGARVLGTGVAIRLATKTEVRAMQRARHGRAFEPEPVGSYRYAEPDHPAASGEAYVVVQAFVEFARDEEVSQRWGGSQRFGERVSLVEDATLDLVRLAREAWDEDFGDLLGDMRIHELGISRWELLSAPRRIELAPDLEARLVPLRRA